MQSFFAKASETAKATASAARDSAVAFKESTETGAGPFKYDAVPQLIPAHVPEKDHFTELAKLACLSLEEELRAEIEETHLPRDKAPLHNWPKVQGFVHGFPNKPVWLYDPTLARGYKSAAVSAGQHLRMKYEGDCPQWRERDVQICEKQLLVYKKDALAKAKSEVPLTVMVIDIERILYVCRSTSPLVCYNQRALDLVVDVEGEPRVWTMIFTQDENQEHSGYSTACLQWAVALLSCKDGSYPPAKEPFEPVEKGAAASIFGMASKVAAKAGSLVAEGAAAAAVLGVTAAMTGALDSMKEDGFLRQVCVAPMPEIHDWVEAHLKSSGQNKTDLAQESTGQATQMTPLHLAIWFNRYMHHMSVFVRPCL